MSRFSRGNLSHQNIIKIIAVGYGIGIVPGITSHAHSYPMVTSKMAVMALRGSFWGFRSELT